MTNKNIPVPLQRTESRELLQTCFKVYNTDSDKITNEKILRLYLTLTIKHTKLYHQTKDIIESKTHIKKSETKLGYLHFWSSTSNSKKVQILTIFSI